MNTKVEHKIQRLRVQKWSFLVLHYYLHKEKIYCLLLFVFSKIYNSFDVIFGK